MKKGDRREGERKAGRERGTMKNEVKDRGGGNR